jgi:hypothetical protein
MIEEKYKKVSQTTNRLQYNPPSQCSKDNKVAPQTTKMYKKCHLFFLYSYNTPILLTNKIIVKKKKNQTIFLKIQKKPIGE